MKKLQDDPIFYEAQRPSCKGIGAHALISWLAVALDQGVAEEIQPLCRQAKRPRVQATQVLLVLLPGTHKTTMLDYLPDSKIKTQNLFTKNSNSPTRVSCSVAVYMNSETHQLVNNMQTPPLVTGYIHCQLIIPGHSQRLRHSVKTTSRYVILS